METVEKDLARLVSNFVCGLFKSVYRMEYNSHKIVEIFFFTSMFRVVMAFIYLNFVTKI